jgi:chromosome segregation ATPase
MSATDQASLPFREIPTPNADAERTHLNWTSGAKTSAAVCAGVAARQMQEAHREDVDAYARPVEQARAEALLGKKAREQQSRALAKLRGEVTELQGAKVEATRLADENRKLALELHRQKKYFDDQLAAVKALLDRAGAKFQAVLSEIGFWKRDAEAARAEADELRELLSPAPERAPSARPGG